MKQAIFKTTDTYAPLAVRLLLATVLFPHGAQKLLGWFDGDFHMAMYYFTEQLHFPWLLGLLIMLIEFFGPIALVIGWATRLWSITILILLIGIVITAHHTYFFMNWFGAQQGEGAEFFLLAIGMAISLTISGGGKLSLDKWITKPVNPKGLYA